MEEEEAIDELPVAVEEDKGGTGEEGRSVRRAFMKQSKVDMPMMFLVGCCCSCCSGSSWLLLLLLLAALDAL